MKRREYTPPRMKAITAVVQLLNLSVNNGNDHHTDNNDYIEVEPEYGDPD